MLNGINKKKNAVKSPVNLPNLFLRIKNINTDEDKEAKIVTSLPHSSNVKMPKSLKSPA